MPKCKYVYEPDFYDDIPPEIPLDCKVLTENGEFCIFHDKNYFEGHEQEAAKRFEDKVRKSIKQNEPLICIGYYLPGINFTELIAGKSFAQPAYFNKTKFTNEAIFVGATFTKEAYFRNARFSKETYFGRATFTEGAYFEYAKFLGEVYFSQNEFTGKLFSEMSHLNKIRLN